MRGLTVSLRASLCLGCDVQGSCTDFSRPIQVWGLDFNPNTGLPVARDYGQVKYRPQHPCHRIHPAPRNTPILLFIPPSCILALLYLSMHTGHGGPRPRLP